MRADLIPVKAAGASVAAKIRPALPGRPSILFLSGFRSSMESEKAKAVDLLAGAEGWGCLRFDYRGHGASGGSVEAFVLSDWIENALAVLDHIEPSGGPVVLVASSMGVWIGVHVALRRRGRIGALVGIAAAPDFTLDLIEPALGEDGRASLRDCGFVERASRYGDDPYRYTRALIEDGRRLAVLRSEIPLGLPVRLIHGMSDPDVPWRQSLRLAQALSGDDVALTLVKGGDHRLSRPADLEIIGDCVRGAVSACAGATR